MSPLTPATSSGAPELPSFDCRAFTEALDAERRRVGFRWMELADVVWGQSADLNAVRGDHPLCGGAMSRLPDKDSTSCQYAMFMLRWLGRAPEDFLTGPVVDVGPTDLPIAGPDKRLRWDLAELYAAVNDRRHELDLTWAELGRRLGCSPSRLTNLRTARLTEMDLAMRLTQWLRRAAAHFIHPADW